LLRDLHEADHHLAFWQRQVAAGGSLSHGAFMLLGRGPAAFAADMAGALRRARKLLAAATAGAGPGGAELHRELQEGTESADGNASATDLMQQRILLLRGLRSRLAVAVAQLVEAAGGLRGVTAPAPPQFMHGNGSVGGGVGFAATGSPSTFAASAAGGNGGPVRQRTQLQGIEEAVRNAAAGMRAALEELLQPRNDPATPPAPGDRGGGGGGSGAGAQQATVGEELQALLRLLALQPLAARALKLAPQQHHLHSQQLERLGGGGDVGAGTAATADGAGSPSPSAAPPAAAGGGAGGAAEPLELALGDASARSALGAARRAAALSGPLVALPPVARMPSRLQRHWLRYGAAAVLGLYGALWLVRHSRLAGSSDLDRWALGAACAVRSALRTHVVEPLAAVRDELFRTFRDRPAAVSASDFAISRESLLRMLADFAADRGGGGAGDGGGGSAGGGGSSDGGGGGGGGIDDPAVASGMSMLMRSYEAELRRPLRNLLAGDLARALLIQVQHVKVDGEGAMLRLDQILRANELTVSLLAALPALTLSWAALAGLTRLLVPRAPDPKREAVPARLAMAALEVALEGLARAEAGA
ncbi:Nuclear control of ATPase protein 2, partial [Tetrabaena socialis]